MAWLYACSRMTSAVRRPDPIESGTRRQILAIWRLWLLLSAVVLFDTNAHATTPEPKRVMILHSFGNDFRPWGEYARTIRSELARQSRWLLDIQEHALTTARSADEN